MTLSLSPQRTKGLEDAGKIHAIKTVEHVTKMSQIYWLHIYNAINQKAMGFYYKVLNAHGDKNLDKQGFILKQLNQRYWLFGYPFLNYFVSHYNLHFILAYVVSFIS